MWSRKGDELFYRSDAMMSVRITPGVSFIPSTPERLFDDRGYTKGAGHTGYDNWFDELKERLSEVTLARGIRLAHLTSIRFVPAASRVADARRPVSEAASGRLRPMFTVNSPCEYTGG